MSIDRITDGHFYMHLTSEDIKRFDLAEGGNNPLGPRRGSHPFYEGRLDFEGRDILFILHKEIADEKTFQHMKSLFGELYTAQMLSCSIQQGELLRKQHSQNIKGASEIYTRYGVPESLWSQRGGAISNALYNAFHTSANIIVPGFVDGFSMHRSGRFISSVELVPPVKKDIVTTTFRMNGYKGVLDFW